MARYPVSNRETANGEEPLSPSPLQQVTVVELPGAAIVTLSLCAGAGSLALAWYISRFWGTAGASWFVGTMLVQAGWALAYGIGLLVGGPDSAVSSRRRHSLGWPLSGPSSSASRWSTPAG